MFCRGTAWASLLYFSSPHCLESLAGAIYFNSKLWTNARIVGRLVSLQFVRPAVGFFKSVLIPWMSRWNARETSDSHSHWNRLCLKLEIYGICGSFSSTRPVHDFVPSALVVVALAALHHRSNIRPAAMWLSSSGWSKRSKLDLWGVGAAGGGLRFGATGVAVAPFGGDGAGEQRT